MAATGNTNGPGDRPETQRGTRPSPADERVVDLMDALLDSFEQAKADRRQRS